MIQDKVQPVATKVINEPKTNGPTLQNLKLDKNVQHGETSC